MRALELASEAGAGRWAPQAQRNAEIKTREALAELRRQEVRFLPFRDFRRARRLLRSAEAASALARDMAERRRESAVESSRRSLASATAFVDSTEVLFRAIRLDHRASETMRLAKIHLREAELMLAQREYDTARLRADQAVLEARLVRGLMAEALRRFTDTGNLRRWRSWREDLISWSARTGEAAILVNKDEGLLTLYVAGRPLRSYEVELGLNQLQRKTVAGDTATPEGRYRIKAMKGAGRSRYHKALELDYPNDEDLARLNNARLGGTLPSGARAGGLIEIHGGGGRGRDWTDGCISLTDGEMDDLFGRVRKGTPVTIIGGDGEGGLFSEIAGRLAPSGAEDGTDGE